MQFLALLLFVLWLYGQIYPEMLVGFDQPLQGLLFFSWGRLDLFEGSVPAPIFD